MLREFDAQLQKGDNPGAWTCVVMDDVNVSVVEEVEYSVQGAAGPMTRAAERRRRP
jgi:hypothetical protein